MKRHLHRFVTYTNGTNFHVDELKLRLDKIEKTYSQFADIIAKLKEAQVMTHAEGDKEQAKFEKDYFKAIAKAQEILNPEANASAVHFEYVDLLEFVRMMAEGRHSGRRVESNTIPMFTGARKEWYNFWQEFNTKIDSDESLSYVEKYDVLLRHLDGPALKSIDHLGVTAESYYEALQILREKYEEPIPFYKINRRIDMLMEMEPMGHMCEIDDFLNNVISILDKLKAYNEPVEYWNHLLVNILKRKLDEDTLVEWEHQLASGLAVQSVDSLLSFLKERYVENFFNVEANSARMCYFCIGYHELFACPKFREKNVRARWDAVRNLQRCSNCLKGGHTVEVCWAGNCRKCGRRHNTLLHH